MKVLDLITSKVTDKICYFVSFFSMAVCVILTVILTADVIVRKISLIPGFPGGATTIKGVYELAQILLCLFVFSTWAYTQSVHGHINVTMFINAMPRVVRFIAYAVTSLFSVITMCFGAYAAYQFVFDLKASKEATATLLIEYWPFVMFEFVAMILLVVTLSLDTCKAIVAIWNDDMAAEIEKDWV